MPNGVWLSIVGVFAVLTFYLWGRLLSALEREEQLKANAESWRGMGLTSDQRKVICKVMLKELSGLRSQAYPPTLQPSTVT